MKPSILDYQILTSSSTSEMAVATVELFKKGYQSIGDLSMTSVLGADGKLKHTLVQALILTDEKTMDDVRRELCQSAMEMTAMTVAAMEPEAQRRAAYQAGVDLKKNGYPLPDEATADAYCGYNDMPFVENTFDTAYTPEPAGDPLPGFEDLPQAAIPAAEASAAPAAAADVPAEPATSDSTTSFIPGEAADLATGVRKVPIADGAETLDFASTGRPAAEVPAAAPAPATPTE
jgi:hypothetical protein